ncbi:glycosyl hydrolase [Listeria costaricensis]|uniref:glycoside hydrolase family 38 N-terminal domain-containing protein n=1 Tax=Listeria costaricensis TaxID=2026604 RepID=UPI000C070520|nr:glycosyl hydrolase [Listeria costaricensis]
MELLLIHHSHTDIGYTQRQEKIERYHVDFIKQAIQICEKIESGERPDWQGFCWNCENTWQVERFFEDSTAEEQAAFRHFVELGYIDISGSYLNMTELISPQILSNKIKRGLDVAATLGKRPHVSMTADVNGYSWGYADVLSENGIDALYSCIHTHHGMFPLGRKQQPFYWEAPSGAKILTWLGDQYHFGNELGFCPNGGGTYSFGGDGMEPYVYKDEWQVLETRIFGLLDKLREEDYAFDFYPMMISGVMTDNAPPNGAIMEAVTKWNAAHGDQVTARMITLDDFFAKLKQVDWEIPTYKGDWNDWWADGVGSTMGPVKSFRAGQRDYELARKLGGGGADSKLLAEAEDQLLLYAEHTWGYSSSVSEPWDTLVNELDLRKSCYATNGATAASKALYAVLAEKGALSIAADQPNIFKIINPHAETRLDRAKLFFDYWEFIDGEQVDVAHFDERYEIVDEAEKTYPLQAVPCARGIEFEVMIELAPQEERVLKLRKKEEIPRYVPSLNMTKGAEGIADFKKQAGLFANIYQISTDYFDIQLDEKLGVAEIRDKADGHSILRADRKYAPFTGIYEQTPIATSAVEERRLMGRNRKAPSTRRHTAELIGMKKIADGAVFATVVLNYQLAATKRFDIHLKAYYHMPKIVISVKYHKESCWEPENLYLALPFTTNETEQLWLEKSGCQIRPKIDQLPLSNEEFYLIQEGLGYIGENKTVQVAVKDVPLITTGSLEAHEICFENDGTEKPVDVGTVFSWLQNNFWETNFKVDLSGFYEFDYTLELCHEVLTPEQVAENCHAENQGFVGIRVEAPK